MTCELCGCSGVDYSDLAGLWVCMSCYLGLTAGCEIGALDESQIQPYESPKRLYRAPEGTDPTGDFAQGLVMTAWVRGYAEGLADYHAALKATQPSPQQTLQNTHGLLA